MIFTIERNHHDFVLSSPTAISIDHIRLRQFELQSSWLSLKTAEAERQLMNFQQEVTSWLNYSFLRLHTVLTLRIPLAESFATFGNLSFDLKKKMNFKNPIQLSYR